MSEHADSVSIGFTGTQKGMTSEQIVSVRRLLQQAYQPGGKFHHGGCLGADVEAAAVARDIGFWTVRHPGDTPEKQAQFFFDDDTRPVAANLTRNRMIVGAVDMMIAAPAGAKEVLRSGTWATIRYTRQVERPLRIVWPDGSVEVPRDG